MSPTRRQIFGMALSTALCPRLGLANAEFSLSPEQERRLGQICWQDYAKEAELVETPETTRFEKYLTQIGSKMTGHLRRPMRYSFRLDPNPRYISACAFPGGLVIVGNGIISYADSEDALAAVLGHEIMHCDLGHTTGRVREAQKAHKLHDFELAKIPVDDYGNTYSHEQELAADREGVKAAVAAGYSPYGMRRLFELFEFMGRGTKPAPGSLTIEMRVAQLDGLIAQYNWQNLIEKRTAIKIEA